MPETLDTPTFPPILDDLPASRDSLDFEPYVETLADIVTSPSTKTPLTVGIFGRWGSGKTTLLHMIEAAVRSRHPAYTLLWFDAWKFDKQDTLWRALLLRVLARLKETIQDGPGDQKTQDLERLSALETSLYRVVEREDVGNIKLDLNKLGAGLAGGAVQIALSLVPGGSALSEFLGALRSKESDSAVENLAAAVSRERIKIHIDQVQFLEQFQQQFSELVERYVTGRGAGQGRLVMFIDDLDRCLPEKAIEVLEAIKLFLDVPGCIFVLGLDHEVIARGIEAKYKDPHVVDGIQYLEKIIQLPFQIPPIEDGDMEAFVESLSKEWPDTECLRVFAEGLGGNPRRVKRTVNVFFLVWRLAKAREGKLKSQVLPVRLAKVVVLQQEAGELYEILKGAPAYLLKLEAYFASRPDDDEETGQETVVLPDVLAQLAKNPAIERLFRLHPPGPSTMNFAGLTTDELRVYFTLTRRAEAPAMRTEPALGFHSPECVFVAPGFFPMGSTKDDREASSDENRHSLDLPGFSIGRYEVTNAEYQVFIQETMLPPPPGWTKTSYPEGKGAHPVANVSWDDSVAYCKWLSRKTGQSYTLPSEAEWEKTARGVEGRIYPWGNDFVANNLNSKKGGPGETTPVGQYSPVGDSPCGAADMAGNVWEWTRSLYVKDYPYDPADGRENLEASGNRVLRGGSYAVQPKNARCAARLSIDPKTRGDRIGFRVSREAQT